MCRLRQAAPVQPSSLRPDGLQLAMGYFEENDRLSNRSWLYCSGPQYDNEFKNSRGPKNIMEKNLGEEGAYPQTP
ncbi:hypothetical protein ACRALDRAFT_208077 [Sodiomyces alcalophilus JCM 7366]|uniref:uncharacterized protein n=1 Tax=Sodiomyces alcalophilus JCM 7366 TaxID=591952 RepID=UPI0039B68492